jgi:hypothetical protein
MRKAVARGNPTVRESAETLAPPSWATARNRLIAFVTDWLSFGPS